MHPINNKNFGAKSGRLAVKFYDGSSVKTGWVLAQVGTSRYKVTNGTTTKIVNLAQTASELTALTAGTGDDASKRATLCTIEITPFGGSVENVKKLTHAQAFTVQESFVTWKLGVSATKAGQGTVAIVANSAPTVANAIPDQAATVVDEFTFTFAADTFADLNADTLTYTATKGDDDPLPDWLEFDAATRTFTKEAETGDAGTLTVKVTASDGTASVSDSFDIVVS